MAATTGMKRRDFLRTVAAAVAGSALPLDLLGCGSGCGREIDATGPVEGRFGPLRPDPEGLLDLPEGFTYRIVSERHQPMDDGYRVPGLPDGMGCFEGPDGSWLLLRNHEISFMQASQGPVADGRPMPAHAFDPTSFGGVTRLLLRPGSLEKLDERLLLYGTERNCAGGRTPWGWISCEESTRPGHGWAFLVRSDWTELQPPQRLAGFGRFYREAVAFDPRTGITYQTEDHRRGCLYRFVPERPQAPFGRGRLQAMKVVGREAFDTAVGLSVGDELEVTWIDVPDPAATEQPTREQLVGPLGAAMVARGEGIDWDGKRGEAVVAATSGGPLELGQIFRYRPDGPDGGVLKLVAQAEGPDPAAFEMPDNVVIAPWGEPVFCEDGPGHDFVRVLHADGTVSDVARHARGEGEVTGVCFSPDGSTMFFNIQGPGLTVAVQGPFPRV